MSEEVRTLDLRFICLFCMEYETGVERTVSRELVTLLYNAGAPSMVSLFASFKSADLCLPPLTSKCNSFCVFQQLSSQSALDCIGLGLVGRPPALLARRLHRLLCSSLNFSHRTVWRGSRSFPCCSLPPSLPSNQFLVEFSQSIDKRPSFHQNTS